MENTTLKNDSVLKILHCKFYFLILDAEYKEPIEFNNQLFNYKPTGNHIGTHSIAEKLGNINGKLSFPTLCL